MVFQNYALWPHMTVFQNIAYGLRLRRLGRVELEAPVEEGLRRSTYWPGRQVPRPALGRPAAARGPGAGARAEPDILLLDEPLSNLDAKIRVQVRAEIRTLQQEVGITTVYVTHDQEEALSLSDRMAVMRDGRVLQLGPPRELYERPRTRFVADFVGTNNLVAGRVVEAGETVLVETALGTCAPGRLAGAARWVGQSCMLRDPARA